MTPKISADLPSIVHRFIEDAGTTSQSMGVGRVLGQIYAFLYFSRGPRSLADMQLALGISKGSASTGVRQLEQWGAARRVWVRGDRKDYYEANDWFGKILKSMLAEIIGTKLDALQHSLDMAEEEIQDDTGDEDISFIRERVKQLRQFQAKALKTWKNPVFQRLLK
jgi:DNA-binding transcriptional regulator GbsR (MarR family)